MDASFRSPHARAYGISSLQLLYKASYHCYDDSLHKINHSRIRIMMNIYKLELF